MSGDLEKLAETVGKVVAANMKAQASVVVAVLSTLVDQKVLSIETVENQILKGLEATYRPLSEKSDQVLTEMKLRLPFNCSG